LAGVPGLLILSAAPDPDFVFALDDGTRLPARVWRPAGPPKAIILALHGFTDSRDAWVLPAQRFTAAGYEVYAPDQRGFGATSSRGQWGGAQRMVNDAQNMLRILKARSPRVPLVLIGESMGGAITLCVRGQSPDAADHYILSSPAVWGFGQMEWGVRAALSTAELVAPHWHFSGKSAPRDRVLTDNRAALLAMADDPLTIHVASVEMLYGLTELMSLAQEAAGGLRNGPPVLMLVGQKDRVVPPAAYATAYRKMAGAVRLGVYLNGYHLLLRDRARALPIGDILAWLEDRDAYLPSGADINAAVFLASATWEAKVSGLAPAASWDGVGAPLAYPW